MRSLNYERNQMKRERKPSVLITGAGRGFGRDLTDVFIESNWTVLALVRTAESAETLKAELGDACRILIGDISNITVITTIAQVLEERGGPLDVLVNNAGIPGRTPVLADIPLEEMEGLFRVHCVGALHCVQAVLPWLKAADAPLVINVTSRLGSLTNVTAGRFSHLRVSYAYRVAKAAQNMLTACMNQDPELEGIRTLAVHPGRLTTTRNASIDADVTSREAAEKMFDLVIGKTEAPGLYFDLITNEPFDW